MSYIDLLTTEYLLLVIIDRFKGRSAAARMQWAFLHAGLCKRKR